MWSAAPFAFAVSQCPSMSSIPARLPSSSNPPIGPKMNARHGHAIRTGEGLLVNAASFHQIVSAKTSPCLAHVRQHPGGEVVRWKASRHPCTRWFGQSRARANCLIVGAVWVIAGCVEAHLDQPLRVADLAAVVYLSEHHFLRAFGLVVGQTPHR